MYAQYNLGVMYENGRGVAQDDLEAVTWYRLAAEQGHARAQFNLGWMYGHGRGVVQDEIEAVKWYGKAAEQEQVIPGLQPAEEQGHARAQFNLGWMYDHSRGVVQDETEAVEWYGKAAPQEQANAQFLPELSPDPIDIIRNKKLEGFILQRHIGPIQLMVR